MISEEELDAAFDFLIRDGAVACPDPLILTVKQRKAYLELLHREGYFKEQA